MIDLTKLSDDQFHTYVVALLGGLATEPIVPQAVRDQLAKVAERLQKEWELG